MSSDPSDDPRGLRSGVTSPLDMPPPRDEHEGGEERHHREPGENDRGPGDEAELPDAGEVRQHEHIERARRRERAAQHSGSRAHRGRLERLPRRAAEATLLVVAEEQVDAVVGAEADDDRDEHDREDREMADHERHDAERPADAHGERGEHEDRHAEPSKGDGQHAERQREGERRCALAVAEGSFHLVVAEHRSAGQPSLHVGELRPDARHRRAEGCDRVPIVREARLLTRRLDQQEEEALVVGEEEARFVIAVIEREERSPW